MDDIVKDVNETWFEENQPRLQGMVYVKAYGFTLLQDHLTSCSQIQRK